MPTAASSTSATSVPVLSAASREAFQRDGFLHLGRVLDASVLAAIRGEEAWLRARVAPLNGAGIEPATETVFRSHVLPYAPACRAFALGGPHLPVVAELIGGPVVSWFSQFVTKPPEPADAGGRSVFPWHQDNGYAAMEPATNLTVWTALDDVDEANGCVWVVPGSHRGGLLPHRTASGHGWHLTLDVDGPGIPVPMRAGEAVLFSGLTLHRSLRNGTAAHRRAFFLEYAHADARRLDPQSGEPQPIVERPHAHLVGAGAASLPLRAGAPA